MANPYIPPPPAPIPPQYPTPNGTQPPQPVPGNAPASGGGRAESSPGVQRYPAVSPPPSLYQGQPPYSRPFSQEVYQANSYVYYPQVPYYQPPVQMGQGQAIASLVLGIIAMISCSNFFIIAPPCAIIGLVLGILAKKKGNNGMATAGIVLSSVGLAISLCVIILLIIVFASLSDIPGDHSFYYDGYQQAAKIVSRFLTVSSGWM